MCWSSLLRNGLLRKCLVTKYVPRVWLSQRTCPLATLRHGVSGPATICTRHIQVSVVAAERNSHLLGGVSTGPGVDAICTDAVCGQERGSQEFLAMVCGTNTVPHRGVLSLWFFCYCFTVFAPFLLFLSEVVTGSPPVRVTWKYTACGDAAVGGGRTKPPVLHPLRISC